MNSLIAFISLYISHMSKPACQRYSQFQNYRETDMYRQVSEIVPGTLSDPNRKARHTANELMQRWNHAHYPDVDKVGASDARYRVSSYDYGCDTPKPMHVPFRHFPRSYRFSESFTGRIHKFDGFITCNSMSKVHKSRDQFYV